jgi:hypothetical protein
MFHLFVPLCIYIKHRGEIQSRRQCLGKKLVQFKIEALLLRLFNNIHSKNKLMLFRTE